MPRPGLSSADPPLTFTLGLYVALLDRLLDRTFTGPAREHARCVFHDLGADARDGKPRRDRHAEPHKDGKPRRRMASVPPHGRRYLRVGDERELGAWIAAVLKERIDGP